MGVVVLKNPYLMLNSVNLTSFITEITLTYEAETKETTASSTGGARTKTSGLKNWTADITFNQDYTAGAVDATLFPLVGAAEFPVELRHSGAAVGPTNPKYTGNAILPSYNPIAGKVGDLLTTKIKLEGSGDLTRATA